MARHMTAPMLALLVLHIFAVATAQKASYHKSDWSNKQQVGRDGDTYTETRTESLGEGVSNAFAEAALGAALVFISCCLLWWNEGNYVRSFKALAKVQKQAVSLSKLRDSSKVPSGTIVRAAGRATATSTKSELTDKELGVHASMGAMRLKA